MSRRPKSHVYVFELDDKAGVRDDPAYPHVYVGETNHSVEARFAVDLAGGRTAAAIVKRYGVRIRYDLFEGMGPFDTRDEAVKAQDALQDDLARRGYTVHGGKGPFQLRGKGR